MSSFVRKMDVSYRADTSCCCMKFQVRVDCCVWILLTKEVFICCLLALRSFFSLLLCDLGAEILQPTFPDLPCQLPVRSLMVSMRGDLGGREG